MKNKFAVIISAFLIIALSVSITLSSFAGAGNVKGDVDLDGKLTVRDAKCVLKYKAGLVQLSSSQKKNADANSDGDITLADARYILEAIVGLRVLSNVDLGSSELNSDGYFDIDEESTAVETTTSVITQTTQKITQTTTEKSNMNVGGGDIEKDTTGDAIIDWRD